MIGIDKINVREHNFPCLVDESRNKMTGQKRVWLRSAAAQIAVSFSPPS